MKFIPLAVLVLYLNLTCFMVNAVPPIDFAPIWSERIYEYLQRGVREGYLLKQLPPEFLSMQEAWTYFLEHRTDDAVKRLAR